jgi:hypothetical protein
VSQKPYLFILNTINPTWCHHIRPNRTKQAAHMTWCLGWYSWHGRPSCQISCTSQSSNQVFYSLTGISLWKWQRPPFISRDTRLASPLLEEYQPVPKPWAVPIVLAEKTAACTELWGTCWQDVISNKQCQDLANLATCWPEDQRLAKDLGFNGSVTKEKNMSKAAGE